MFLLLCKKKLTWISRALHLFRLQCIRCNATIAFALLCSTDCKTLSGEMNVNKKNIIIPFLIGDMSNKMCPAATVPFDWSTNEIKYQVLK